MSENKEFLVLSSASNMQDIRQTQRNNHLSKCVWKVGVIRVGKGSREKAPKGGGMSENAEIQSRIPSC